MPQSAEVYHTEDNIIQLCTLIYRDKELKFNAFTKSDYDTGMREGETIAIKGNSETAKAAAEDLQRILSPIAKASDIQVVNGDYLVVLDSPSITHPEFSDFLSNIKKTLEQEWTSKAIIPGIVEVLKNIPDLHVERDKNTEYGFDTIRITHTGGDDKAWRSLIADAEKYNAVDMNKVSAADLKRWIVPFELQDNSIAAPYKPMVNFLSSGLRLQGRPLPATFEAMNAQRR